MIQCSNHTDRRRRLFTGAIVTVALCAGLARPAAADVEIGGHLMVLGAYQDIAARSGEGESLSGLSVNSLELGARFSPSRYADATVVWLLEEDFTGGDPEQGMVLDQAFVTIAGNGRVLAARSVRDGLDDSPWYAQAGKMYVPFATHFEYHTFDVVSEPPTLELGETLETGVQIGWIPAGPAHLFAGAYIGRGPHGNEAFIAEDGDASRADDEANDFFVGVAGDFGFGSAVVSWMSNLNDSIALADELDPAEDAVGGLDIYASAVLGPAHLQVNYVAALDDYTAGAYAGLRPRALAAEVTFAGLEVGGREVAITGVYWRTDDWPDRAADSGGVVLDAALTDGITLSAQYLHRRYERSSALRSEDLIALQLTAGFGWEPGR